MSYFSARFLQTWLLGHARLLMDFSGPQLMTCSSYPQKLYITIQHLTSSKASSESVFLKNTCRYFNLYRFHCPTQVDPALPCWSAVPGSKNLSSLSSHRGAKPKLWLWISLSRWRSVHDSFQLTLAAQRLFKCDFSLGEMSSTTSAAWNLSAF